MNCCVCTVVIRALFAFIIALATVFNAAIYRRELGKKKYMRKCVGFFFFL